MTTQLTLLGLKMIGFSSRIHVVSVTDLSSCETWN